MPVLFINGIEVWSPEPRLEARDLDPDTGEDKKYEAAWVKMSKSVWNRAARLELFADDKKNAVKQLLGHMLKKKNTTFDGYTPQGGLGIQELDMRDVMGVATAAQIDWDALWATVGWRNWLSNNLPDAVAYGAQATIVPRDANNDEWAVLTWGVLDFAAAPLVRSIRVSQAKEDVGDELIEDQMRGTEQVYADFGRIYAHWPPHNFSYGVELTEVPGISALRPVGAVIGTATRLRQTGALFRNRCQPG